MCMMTPDTLLEWSLEGEARRNSARMIEHILRVARQGGGTVPLKPFLKILQFPPASVRRITSHRGDFQVQSPNGPKGRLEGQWVNRGTPLQEPVPQMEFIQPVMQIDPVVTGMFEARPGVIRLTGIRGMTIIKTIIEQDKTENVEFSYRVERLILKADSMAVF